MCVCVCVWFLWRNSTCFVLINVWNTDIRARISPYGIWFQVLWQVWCLVGVIGWGNLLRTYGIWFLVVWCGLFGWKETGALLRLRRERLFSYKRFVKILFLNGLSVGDLQIVLLLWSSFLPLEVHLKFLLFFFFFFLLLCFAVFCVHHHEHL